MDIIKTATGRGLKTDYAVFMDNPPLAFIRIIGKDILECTAIFSDPNETEKITYGDTAYEGYTHLVSSANETGAVKVQLSR